MAVEQGANDGQDQRSLFSEKKGAPNDHQYRASEYEVWNFAYNQREIKEDRGDPVVYPFL